MTFSTIVVSITFITTSVFLFALIVSSMFPEPKYMRTIRDYKRGYRTRVSFWKVLIVVAIWAGSGIFLFG